MHIVYTFYTTSHEKEMMQSRKTQELYNYTVQIRDDIFSYLESYFLLYIFSYNTYFVKASNSVKTITIFFWLSGYIFLVIYIPPLTTLILSKLVIVLKRLCVYHIQWNKRSATISLQECTDHKLSQYYH